VKAALLTAVDAPLEIVDLEIDDPGPHEVRVRTAAAGVCHSDLHVIEGKYPSALPAVLGHEAAGVVEAVGSAVEYVRPGDHVITCISMWCGNCRNCIRGRPSLCSQEGLTRLETDKPRLTQDGTPVIQFSNLSCFAEEMLVHEKAIAKVTKEIPLDKAALIGCGVVTGVGAVQNTAEVRPGDAVAVVGCGGIGLNAVQGARLAGAERIIAIDRLASKLELARKFGATDIVDASQVDPVEAVRDLTGGGVDHAIEAVGLKTTAEQCFSMVAMGGTATVIGMLPVGTKIELMGLELLAEKKIQGSVMGSTRFRVDMPSYIQLYLQGRLNLDDLVSRVITLEEINEAFGALKTGEVARSLIRMGA
jgi:S-(hydroxymethyl)glutathione dehydrogenase/alcohol dehydrogenase